MRLSLLSQAIWIFSIDPSNAFAPNCRRSRHASELRMSLPNSFDTLTSGLASIVRLPFGTIVSSTLPTKDLPKITALYDIEGSTSCRLVRERITELDLSVGTVIPATSNSRAATDESYEYYIGDAAKDVPRMVVDDGKVEVVYSGADDVLGYLTDVCGPRPPIVDDSEEELKKKVVEALVLASEPFPSLFRYGRGNAVAGCALSKETPRPSSPLVLYSYEGNQFCRLVREVLCELDVPYELRSSGKGSSQRKKLAEITGGSTQCPYLIDPNTDTKMPESKDIIEYLYKNYATFVPPNELLGAISNVITPLLKPVYKVIAPLQAGSNREDKAEYEREILAAEDEIKEEIATESVVIYTYSLSPFCTEAISVLESLDVKYKEISLGREWLPFFINENGSQKRAALGKMTGQTSLPHVFVNGQSVGGLYEGLLPALEDRSFWDLLKNGASTTKENGSSKAKVIIEEGSFE